MSRRNLFVSLGAMAGLVLFFYLLVHLLLLRYAKGDVYPPSSTLRPDPLGTRAFYEALPDAGKYDVARGYVSLRRELALKPAAVLVLGMDAYELNEFTSEEVDELNDYVQKGGRVVMTLNPMNGGGDFDDDDTAENKGKKKSDAKKASAKDEKDQEPDKERPLAIPIPDPLGEPKTAQEKHEREEFKKEQEAEERHDPDRFIPGKFQPSIQAVWGFSWTFPGEKSKESKDDNKDSKGSSEEPAAAGGSSAEYAHGDVLAESTGAVQTESRVPWKSPLSFIRVDPAWQVAYTAKGKPVVIARKWGQGDVIVATDSYFVSNEALHDDRKPLLLAWIAGPSGLLLFDETHLGVQEKEGVMVLARRYRLEGYLYGLLFVTGLFLWRQSVPLVPPLHARAQAAGGVVSGRDSRSGLVNLLRRNIAPRVLLATCLAEWRRHASRGSPAERTAEMERLAAQNAAPEHLIETYRQLSRVNTGEQKRTPMQTNLEQLAHLLQSVRAEVGKVILGQDEVIDRSLIAILIGQHALVEGVPGVAKTLLVRTLAHVLGCDFSRVQFTPDLMPADITGTSVFNFQSSEFTLMPGPIFTTFLLADEINRAPAKTQSALLQAMQERTVSIDRHSYALSPAFTVFATQNPVEYEGTYPLAEAQKDRFALKISMPCPERDDELNLARRMLGHDSPEATLAAGAVQPLLTPESLVEARGVLEQMAVREEMLGYILDLVRATRTHEAILVGAGPRATQSLLLASRASAALVGHDFVSPDDVRSMLNPVLEHRLILRPEYEIEGRSIAEVLQQIVQAVPVPR